MLHKYLFRIYYILDTLLDVDSTLVNKVNSLCLQWAYSLAHEKCILKVNKLEKLKIINKSKQMNKYKIGKWNEKTEEKELRGTW